MSAWAIALITMACVLLGAWAGMAIARVLPEHHLSDDTKDVVKLVSGVLATLTALVLGLLIASAKTSFDEVGDRFRQVAAKIIVIDRLLADYGPEAAPARKALRDTYAARIEQLFPEGHRPESSLATLARSASMDGLSRMVVRLPAHDDEQRALRSQMQNLIADVSQSRWIGYEENANSTPWPFLLVLISWLAAMFMSFGLYAPRNGTVFAALAIGAMAVATAVFLIEEMIRPLDGIIAVQPEPMRAALAVLDARN